MKFVFTDKKVTLPNFIHKYAEKKGGKAGPFFLRRMPPPRSRSVWRRSG